MLAQQSVVASHQSQAVQASQALLVLFVGGICLHHQLPSFLLGPPQVVPLRSILFDDHVKRHLPITNFSSLSQVLLEPQVALLGLVEQLNFKLVDFQPAHRKVCLYRRIFCENFAEKLLSAHQEHVDAVAEPAQVLHRVEAAEIDQQALNSPSQHLHHLKQVVHEPAGVLHNLLKHPPAYYLSPG